MTRNLSKRNLKLMRCLTKMLFEKEFKEELKELEEIRDGFDKPMRKFIVQQFINMLCFTFNNGTYVKYEMKRYIKILRDKK